jgi:PPOX class probable F420-dependent enzyme
MISSRQLSHERPSTGQAKATLGRYEGQWAALLTTYRRDGRPVGTPVNVVVDGDRVLFRTYAQTGKFKRLARDQRVTLQPCDARGRVPAADAGVLRGVARLLSGDEDVRAGRLIDAKYPFFQCGLVRLVHRLARYRTVHFAIDLADEGMLGA